MDSILAPLRVSTSMSGTPPLKPTPASLSQQLPTPPAACSRWRRRRGAADNPEWVVPLLLWAAVVAENSLPLTVIRDLWGEWLGLEEGGFVKSCSAAGVVELAELWLLPAVAPPPPPAADLRWCLGAGTAVAVALRGAMEGVAAGPVVAAAAAGAAVAACAASSSVRPSAHTASTPHRRRPSGPNSRRGSAPPPVPAAATAAAIAATAGATAGAAPDAAAAATAEPESTRWRL